MIGIHDSISFMATSWRDALSVLLVVDIIDRRILSIDTSAHINTLNRILLVTLAANPSNAILTRVQHWSRL